MADIFMIIIELLSDTGLSQWQTPCFEDVGGSAALISPFWGDFWSEYKSASSF